MAPAFRIPEPGKCHGRVLRWLGFSGPGTVIGRDQVAGACMRFPRGESLRKRSRVGHQQRAAATFQTGLSSETAEADSNE
jgi:hypothetical protein